MLIDRNDIPKNLSGIPDLDLSEDLCESTRYERDAVFGMAIYATNAKRVTDEMFIEAAHAVADQVTSEQLKLGMLFPPQSNILEVEIKTAARVAKLVFDSGFARVDRPADMEAFIREHVYNPEYRKLV